MVAHIQTRNIDYSTLVQTLLNRFSMWDRIRDYNDNFEKRVLFNLPFLESVICDAVELFWVILRGVFTRFM